jgi:hypothetical protein
MGRKGPGGPVRSRASWLRQGTMGLRSEAGPPGPTKAPRAPHRSGAEEDEGGGGASPGAAMAKDGGGTGTSELLSKARSHASTAPPALARAERPPTGDCTHRATRPHAAAGTPKTS